MKKIKPIIFVIMAILFATDAFSQLVFDDNSFNDWGDLNQYTSFDMYEAGKTDKDKLSISYIEFIQNPDGTGTLNVLVVAVPPNIFDGSTSENYVRLADVVGSLKDHDGNVITNSDGNSPMNPNSFQFITDNAGNIAWESTYTLSQEQMLIVAGIAIHAKTTDGETTRTAGGNFDFQSIPEPLVPSTPTSVPIDGGLSFLAMIGIGYGIYANRKRK